MDSEEHHTEHLASPNEQAYHGEVFPEVRANIRHACKEFGEEYLREISREKRYPAEFVESITKAKWLSALIPKEYGGLGLGLAEASVIMEEINHSGHNSGNCHAQMFNMGTLLRHGSDEQKTHYLPRTAMGDLRLQSMAVPETGTDTTKTRTMAVKRGNKYVINGRKIWIGRIQHSDLMILLARTMPLENVKKKIGGLSIFIIDLRQALGHGMDVRLVENMVDAETNEVILTDLEIPAESLTGEEGQGLRYIFDGLNAGPILIAAECVGDGYWFIQHAVQRGKTRVVFDRPTGRIEIPSAETISASAVTGRLVRRGRVHSARRSTSGCQSGLQIQVDDGRRGGCHHTVRHPACHGHGYGRATRVAQGARAAGTFRRRRRPPPILL